MDRRELGAGTRVVRAARSLPPGQGVPVVPPLVQSVAFDYGSAAEQDAVFGNDRPGYVYGRYGTPTTAALESVLAELDGVEAVTCFVTGMAAISAAVDACAISRGGRVVAQEDCYGQTRALFERWVRERSADIVFVDTTDHRAVEAALKAKPAALLYAEAIANPLLKVNDVAALARLARDNGASLAVDATFATPVLFRPAALGATMVIHSLTKYLNGHGDVMGGSVGGSKELAGAMRDRTILDGAYLPPHEAWLAIRGMRTVALRIPRQCASGSGSPTASCACPWVSRTRRTFSPISTAPLTASKPLPRALVFNCHITGLAVARSLAAHGIEVIALDPDPRGLGQASKAVVQRHKCPNPLEGGRGFVQYLLDNAKRWEGAVLFPTNDEWVMAVARYRSQLEACYRIPFSELSVIEAVLDKRRLYADAHQLRIPIPKTFTLNDPKATSREIRYPAIVKPAEQRRFYDRFR